MSPPTDTAVLEMIHERRERAAEQAMIGQTLKRAGHADKAGNFLLAAQQADDIADALESLLDFRTSHAPTTGGAA